MTDIISGFLTDLISDAFKQFDALLIKLIKNMLYVEDLFSSALSSSSISNAYTYIYQFCCLLVALKFLFKGFKIYILWRDGDADSSPQDMVIGVAQAAAMMVCFPYLYDLIADLTVTFSDGVMSRLDIAGVKVGDVSLMAISTAGLFELVVLLIYVVLVVVLCVKLIQRGVELLILRLGVPFACLGLLDSDFGLFKSYMQTFYKTMFTSVTQIVLMSLSIRVITNMSLANLICGIAIIAAAFGTPALMQNMLVPSGGGNVTNKIYSGARVVQMAKGLFTK